MNELSIILIILLVLGIIPFVIIMIKRQLINTFKKNSVLTKALVTNCEKRFGIKGNVYYILSLQYKTIESNQILYGTVGSKKQEIGDEIPLMYLPGNPSKFSIDFGQRIPVAIVLTLAFFGLIVWLCVWLGSFEFTNI
jgi:hypothetical protein